MVCKKCKKEIRDNEKFCVYCGAKVKKNYIGTKQNAFIFVFVGAILFLFLAFFGKILSFIPEPINREEFVNYMSDNGCKLKGNANEDKNSNILYFYENDDNSCKYDIKYVITNDSNTSEDIYFSFLDDVYDDSRSVSESYIDFIRYKEYSASGSNYFRVIRNGNSVLYIKTSLENKDSALKVLNKFGYNLNEKMDENDAEIFKIIKAIFTLCTILFLVSGWNIFKKLGRKGWMSLIPIYNLIVFTKDVFGKKRYLFFIFIPFVYRILALYKLGKVFGKTTGEILLLIIFPIIFVPCLAFDDSVYRVIK